MPAHENRGGGEAAAILAHEILEAHVMKTAIIPT